MASRKYCLDFMRYYVCATAYFDYIFVQIIYVFSRIAIFTLKSQ